MEDSKINITVVSTPYKELPSDTMGAVEKVSMERALELYKAGYGIKFVTPINGQNIGVPLLKIEKLETKITYTKESKLRWLFDTKSFTYFKPYLKISQDAIGDITILDGVRIDPWDFIIMHEKFRRSPVINIMHFPGPLFNSIYIKSLPFIYKKRIWGALSIGMYNFMRKLGYKTLYFPNGITIPEQNKIVKIPNRYLLFFGRIEEFKAPHLAITLSKKTGIPLKICGRIYDYQYFNYYVKPFIDGKDVEFLGEIAYDKLFELVRYALAVTYFSNHYDPQSTVLLESISYGVPIVGFNSSILSGSHDIVKNGENGLVIDKNFKISDIETSLYSFNRISIYNKAKKDWSWESVIQNYYIKAFNKVLNGDFR